LVSELLFPEIEARSRDDVLVQLARRVADNTPGLNGAALLSTLKARELQATTAFGDGVAIPHARVVGLDRMVAALARSKEGVDWNAPDGRPVHLILMLAGPADKPDLYLKTLAAVSRMLRDAECRARLTAAAGAEEMLTALGDAGDEAATGSFKKP
jgi:mannitol/fructose-specific phosphotransferase system IIA component (Ntr-type)